MAFDILTDAGFPTDTGGVVKKVDSGTPINNYRTFINGGNVWERVIDGAYRASWACGLVSSGDKTIILQTIFNDADIQEVIFDSGDVTINGTLTIPAGKTIKFLGNGAVTGSGTITGGIVHADRNKWIFKGTVVANFAFTSTGEVSGKWWGAKGDQSQDDQPALQKAIDICIANSHPILRIPAGRYRLDTRGLLIYKGNTLQVSLHVYGDEVGYASAAKSTYFLCNFLDGFGFGIHLGKNVTLKNMQFEGLNAISGSSLDYVFNPASSFVAGGVKDNRWSPHCAISVEPFFHTVTAGVNRYPGFDAQYAATTSNGGSTDCKFENITISNFVVGVGISTNSGASAIGTQNAEALIFDRMWFSSVKVCVAQCQSQSRQNRFTNFKVWSTAKTIFECVAYGLGTGDMPMVDGLNIAGGVYELCNANNAWGDGKFENIFAELFCRLGNMSSGGMPVVFDRCKFDLSVGYYPIDGLGTFNFGAVFNGCTLRYYDDSFEWKPMNFNVGSGSVSGLISFNNCYLNNPCATGNTTDIHRGDVFAYDNCYFYTGHTSSGKSTFPRYADLSYQHYVQEGDVLNYPLSNWYQHQSDSLVRRATRRMINSYFSGFFGGSTNMAYNSGTKKITFDFVNASAAFFVGGPVISRRYGIVGQVESIVGDLTVTVKNCPPIDPLETPYVDWTQPQRTGYSFIGNATAGSAVITGVLVDGEQTTAALQLNYPVFGEGLPYGCRIKSIDSPTQVTLSQVISAGVTGRLTFAPFIYEESGKYNGDLHTSYAFDTAKPVISKGTILKMGIGRRDVLCTIPGIMNSATPANRPTFIEIGDGVITKDSFTLVADGTRSVPAGKFVTRMLVNPASNLTAFKVGTTNGGDELITAQTVTAGQWPPFNIDKYDPTTLYIAGITSSTQIIIYYE